MYIREKDHRYIQFRVEEFIEGVRYSGEETPGSKTRKSEHRE
jgi:hypothetical protein